MAYTPPIYTNIVFNFTAPYTSIPSYTNIVFDLATADEASGSIFPAGFDTSSLGTPDVALFDQTIEPTGFTQWGVSSPDVENHQQFIVPAGLLAFKGFGTANVKNRNSEVFPTAIAPGSVGSHTIGLAIRRLRPTAIDATLWGDAFLSGGVRTLDLSGRGIAAYSSGTAFVSLLVREVFPAWFIATLYGRPLADHHHPCGPLGWDSSAFGQAEVHVPRDFVDLTNQGIAGPLWGDNRVSNYTQNIAPPGFLDAPSEPERFGRPEAYLYVRYIVQLFETAPDDGGAFGHFNLVENVDREIHPDPLSTLRMGVPTIANNARIVTAPPNQDFSLFGTALVAPYVRTITTAGIDTSLWGSPVGWIVYNAARVISPPSIASLAMGTPAQVISNLQTLRMQGFDQTEYGDAFVAFAIRTVAPYSLPEPPPFGLVDVENHQRYVTPAAIAPVGLGVPTLEIHFTIMAPSSILPPVNQVGDDARVRNVTPELGQMGAVMTEWGRPAVYNQHETYALQGFESILWGVTIVRDRRQTVAPAGVAPRPITTLHQVRNVNPDPPGQQYIAPDGLLAGGLGVPAVNANTIRPLGDIHVRFGVPSLRGMGISPVGIPPPYSEETGMQFGIPSLPGAQHINVEDDKGGLPWTEWGAASFWPHYIWAPMGYPYPDGEGEHGEQMDYRIFGPDHPERPVFGLANVTLRNRTLAPTGAQMTVFGIDGRVSLNPQYVHVDGARFTKYGFPLVNGGGAVSTFGADASLFGATTVTLHYTGPQTISGAGGIAPGAFGTAYIDFFNRALLVHGWDSFTISPPHAPSWPRESTWISHEYPPFPAVGFDASAFGLTWVSFYVRELPVEGWDSAIVCDYEPGFFADRMRVRRREHVDGATLGDLASFGVARVDLGTRALRARYIYEFRMGAVTVRNVNPVEPDGWDSSVFGDVDRWEAGKIKAHGDDLAAYGRAIISRALHPDGFVGAVGEPRIAREIVPPSDGGSVKWGENFGRPVLVASVCGNKAMAVPSFDAGDFGVATVVRKGGS